MAYFRNVPSSFFMFYLEEFSNKINIPLEFVKRYKVFLCQPSLKLKTHGSDRSWAVKTTKRNERWFFKGGWSKFVTDNRLIAGNLLIFRIVGESALVVSIFREDSCMDESPSPPAPYAAASDDDDDDDDGRREVIWRFVKRLKHYHFTIARMEIPSIFAWGTNISISRRVKLEYRGGRWPIKITDRNKHVFSMTGGWAEFVKTSNLRPGDILLFQFIPNSGNVVTAVVLEKEFGERMLGAAKKGGLILRH